VFAKLGALSQQLSLDVQGRIRICDKLLQFANLTTTVAMVGSVRMIKVYNPSLLGPEDEVDIDELDAVLSAAGM
jgi:DNA-binding transcriptional regulator/RsmH inhibitor MraZ